MKPAHAPPTDLGPDGRAFYASVLSEFELDPNQFEILAAAARQLDRAATARAEVKTRGLLVMNRHGELAENPAVKVERAAHAAFMRLRRELGVDADKSSETARGPNSRNFR